MSSNTRLSILKPGRPREPLQDLSQLLPTNDDEETTTTDNHKRRVSFACVNKVKEFETEAECTTLHKTPAYDERFSISSDSYQSSILSEASHNKSTFISYADTSKVMNRSKAYGENVDIVELGLHNVSRAAPSPGKMSGADSSMDITSVIVRDEHEYTADYESNSESYYPLNLTKSASARPSMAKAEDPTDKDVLESSSMETTEALPCMMTETIVTDFESFNQTMDISVEDVAAEEEKNSRSSMNLTMGLEKVFHIRESTTLSSEKDIQFTVDAFGDVKDSHVRENTFVKKHLVSFPEEGSCAMEEDTSIFRMQNQILDKENDHPLAENTRIEDENGSQLEETEIVEREMDISFSKSFIPAKETFSLVSNGFEELEDEDTQSEQEPLSLVSNKLEEPEEKDAQSAKERFSLVSNVLEEPKGKDTQSAEKRFSLASNVLEKPKAKVTQSAKERFSLASNVSEQPKDKNKQLAKRRYSLAPNAFKELKEKDTQPAKESFSLLNEPREKDIQPTKARFSLVPTAFEELNEKDTQPAKETFSLVSNVLEEPRDINNQSAVVIENQEENPTPSENSVIEEKIAEPVRDVFADNEVNLQEDEKKSFPDKTLIVEEDMNMSLAESIVVDEEHSYVENIDVEENEKLHSAESSILETKEQSHHVASPVSEEKSQVQHANNSVLEEKEQLKFTQSPGAEEEKQPKSAENSVVEENDSHPEEILAVELQNNLIIENSHMDEKEENLHQDEKQIEKENSIENSIIVEENNPHSPEMITTEAENVQSRENTITEKEISQQTDSGVVEMENIYVEEISYENDGLNFQANENPTEDVVFSNRPLKRKSDSFLPEIPPPEPSPKRPNTEPKSEIALRNEAILNQIKKTLPSEIPYWTVVSTSDTEWKFGALWNRLHLVITLSENENKCTSKLRFIKKDSEIGDEILKVAIAPIIRKYRKKMDELCGKVEDVVIFMKMTSSSIDFAKNFAENFSEIVEFEDISLYNGFASFIVANYQTHLLAKIQVDMRNIDDFSDSSIEVKQNIGHLDEAKVRKIFFEARGDYDFFTKFVKKLNRNLNVL